MRESLELPRSNNIIARPPHYIEGRVIEPIAVIEAYDLCHHLACVVKYLARAGRKTNTLNDLCKAEWYLDRELQRCKKQANPCLRILETSPAFSIHEILEDWKLIADLDTALSYILAARLGYLKKDFNHSKALDNYASSLKLSLKHLQLSIASQEQGEWQ